MNPNRFDKYNKNGSESCHWVGCRKHKRLVDMNRGKFCSVHSEYISYIRANITHEVSRSELFARISELTARKNLCLGHLEYIVMLNEQAAESNVIEWHEYVENMRVINIFHESVGRNNIDCT